MPLTSVMYQMGEKGGTLITIVPSSSFTIST